jgi:ribonuclease-3
MASSSGRAAARQPSSQEALAQKLGHRFQNATLLRQALTHPSAAGPRAPSYERLEFLGDRVVGLIIADLLFQRFPGEAEGALARRHAALVRRETLAEVAEALALGDHVIFARGEREAGTGDNPAILADAMEAVIGALYLDGGLAAARGFVVPFWTPLMEADGTPPQDAKTALQEWAQGRGLPLPTYREVDRQGPDHAPRFTVEAAVEGEAPARGRGSSKRLAEQAAAEDLLARVTAADPAVVDPEAADQDAGAQGEGGAP